jgi:histidine ammonia-lyase
LALDYLAIALADLGNISERRLTRLLDEKANGGLLPPFLTKEGGLNSGFMLLQYTAAALVSENKVLSHPASVDNIPTSANVEDHVSMGALAADKALKVVENVETIVAIELMAAAQAMDFRKEALGPNRRMGRGTQIAYSLIREEVPFIARDELLYPYIQRVQRLVREGILVKEVLEGIGRKP